MKKRIIMGFLIVLVIVALANRIFEYDFFILFGIISAALIFSFMAICRKEIVEKSINIDKEEKDVQQ